MTHKPRGLLLMHALDHLHAALEDLSLGDWLTHTPAA
jgi:hypothetical protein